MKFAQQTTYFHFIDEIKSPFLNAVFLVRKRFKTSKKTFFMHSFAIKTLNYEGVLCAADDSFDRLDI
ncbi:hypothetical protein UA24_03355 [Marinomonas sp. BSi20414]|nr:hypothetical protein [Marinomonas sp. BSi20414]